MISFQTPNATLNRHPSGHSTCSDMWNTSSMLGDVLQLLQHVGDKHNLSAHSSAEKAFRAQSVQAAHRGGLPRPPSPHRHRRCRGPAERLLAKPRPEEPPCIAFRGQHHGTEPYVVTSCPHQGRTQRQKQEQKPRLESLPAMVVCEQACGRTVASIQTRTHCRP